MKENSRDDKRKFVYSAFIIPIYRTIFILFCEITENEDFSNGIVFLHFPDFYLYGYVGLVSFVPETFENQAPFNKSNIGRIFEIN